MAFDKVVDSATLDLELAATADAIRTKTGDTAKIEWAVGKGFADAVAEIETELILQEKTTTPSTSSQTITPDSGYDGLSKVTVNAMPTATQATPSITVSSSGLVTASTTQSAGYVASGTKSATKQLTTQAAKTVTPTASDQTAVASGRYTTGAITVKGDSNLMAGNIKSGVSIFGVAGSYEGSGGGGGSVETCTVTITNTLTGGGITGGTVYFNYTCLTDGVVSTKLVSLSKSTTITISDVVRHSICVVWPVTTSTTISEVVGTNARIICSRSTIFAMEVGTDGTDVSIAIS